jgi:hypothetical protein
VHLPSGPTDFRTTVVKPYLRQEPEPESEEEDDSIEPINIPQAESAEQLRRNTERVRRPPSRFRQNVADISIFL